MKFISKFKLNYHHKLIDDYFAHSNFQDVYSLINRIKNNQSLYFECLLYLDKYLKNLDHSDFYRQKIIWTISYNQEDSLYIDNFINFYLKSSNLNFISNNYFSYLTQILEESNFESLPKIIEFDKFVPLSNLLQNLVVFNSSHEIFLLNTCAAFFEDNQKNYFIYPNKTKCFFYIYKNPFHLFSQYKKTLNSKEAAINHLFNTYDDKYINENLRHKKQIIYENRVNYNIHFNSWTDPNVMSAFKGKAINYDNLVNDPESVLIDVLFHLKQSGLNIEIQYDLVNRFLQENSLSDFCDESLSKKEIKMISKSIDAKLAKEFNI